MELLGELHHAERLAVALGRGMPKFRRTFSFVSAPLLVADDGDRPAAEDPEAGHDRRVVREGPVPAQLDEVAEEDPDVVEREGAGRVASDERLLPRGQVRVDLSRELYEPVGDLADRLVPGGAPGLSRRPSMRARSRSSGSSNR
jgi:hypothetical protein